MQAKPFAVGVRVEHPQELIDRSQYGEMAGDPRLGAAEYRLTGKSGERGVYTFCMCPGGRVVASSSDSQQVVVNGMSNYARNEANANSAIVVQVGPGDFIGNDPLCGMRFCEDLEKKAFELGGGDYSAPISRIDDFLKHKKTSRIGSVRPSYLPGTTFASLWDCLPSSVANGIAEGILDFGKKLKGFDLADGILTGVESRTSSPIRILRDELGRSVSHATVYPVGEGAGYAGGIISAAVDGLRAAERIIAKFHPPKL